MATKELMKWLDDNSPKKLYEAENAVSKKFPLISGNLEIINLNKIIKL